METTTLTRYGDFSPTSFDHAGAFLPDRQDWFVAPVSRNRDSQSLAESNFAAALETLGGESETVEVHRFGHWGPGWFEIILVHPSRFADAQAIADRLEIYPILDEEDVSAREWEDYCESWDSWGRSDYWRGVCRKLPDLPDGAQSILEDVPDEEIDRFAGPAGDRVNWRYEATDEGISINIRGLVESTDLDAVAEWAESEAWAARRRADIRRYCETFGLPARVAREAVRRNLDLRSEIVAICDP